MEKKDLLRVPSDLGQSGLLKHAATPPFEIPETIAELRPICKRPDLLINRYTRI